MELKTGYKKTEVGVIPDDWDDKALHEICGMKSGLGIKTSGIDNFSLYPCFGGNGLRGYANSFTHDGNYALIGRQGALCGNVLEVSGRFFASEHAIVVRSKLQTDISWLTFLLAKMNLNQYSESSAQPGLSVEKILKLRIPTPPNRHEQTAIANALSDTDALIRSLQKLIEKKRQIKQGTMQTLLNPYENGVLRTGWKIVKLGEVCDVKDGTHQTPKYVDSGIPFYSVESVTRNDFVNTKFISHEEHKFLTKNFRIEKGDVLMTRIGSIGDCKYVDWAVDASFYVSLALLKVKDQLSAKFLAHYSTSAYFKKEIELNSLQHAIPKKINLGQISEIKIGIPTDISQQLNLASLLSDMEAEIAALESKLTKYQQIKQGMMQNLLTGRIRLV
ncbi:MAG: restriction endonuclease subunit S [Glaciimonas sp.]|nr:restriction endonuclease subunit S [Glaciimonas sp.]